jgi:SAM-dependent methyltransferase
MNNNLEEFYQTWSDKPEHMVLYDNESSIRKVDATMNGMPVIRELKILSMLDFGCGYGKALQNFTEKLQLDRGYGFDFSGQAVDYANANFSNEKIKYFQLKTLDINENIKYIKSIVSGGKVDCILLIDLLEHIPDCVELIKKLAELTEYFVIKLPIEENLIDNYFLNKTYPSIKQSNGHLREFTVNSVHYFIRKIGLTPVAEGVHIYDFKDSYPPQLIKVSVLLQFKRNLLKWTRMFLSIVLPLRIYIRLIGPGSYYCIATFNKEHVLNP